MNVSTDSVEQIIKRGGEEKSILSFLTADTDFLIILLPILMLLLIYEHKRQLKKFKKIWKEKLESSLAALRESHRKRMDEFKMQPFSMKAEWATLKSDAEKRLEDLRNLKIEVNNQLTSLKLDFQTQVTSLIRYSEKANFGKLCIGDRPAEDLDTKLVSVISMMDTRLLSLFKYVDDKVMTSANNQATRMCEAVKQLETHINSLENSLQDYSTPKLQNGQCD